MSETTANLWMIDEPEARYSLRHGPLLTGFLVGALLGSAVTALATGPIRQALTREPTEVARTWPNRELSGEWRFRPAPVDVDRMFRSRR